MADARKSRTTNRPMSVRAPWRTKRGRRVRDLFAGYMENLETGNPIHEAAALRAAELLVSAEEMRARHLEGRESCAEDVVRFDNAARRAERDLKALKPEPVGWWERDDDGEEDS